MRTISILAAALISVATITHAAAQEFTLRLHQFLPMTDSVPREGLIPWSEAIEEQSGGRIKVEYYPSMQLGGTPPALFDQAREGVADLIWTVLGYTPGRFPKSEVFEMPFLVTDPVPGVTTVTIADGLATTTAFGLATKVVDGLF
jgi:TRAP-type C4-dicarboxylate transport system substrate-binding protein